MRKSWKTDHKSSPENTTSGDGRGRQARCQLREDPRPTGASALIDAIDLPIRGKKKSDGLVLARKEVTHRKPRELDRRGEDEGDGCGAADGKESKQVLGRFFSF